MANKIVKDSGLPIFVKEIAVPEGTLANALVKQGTVAGLANDAARLADDGLYYVNVDTAALIRVDSVAIAFTKGDPVWLTSANAIAAATASGSRIIGYADRTKSAPSAALWVQLVPSAQPAA
jgi:hypothetical protein